MHDEVIAAIGKVDCVHIDVGIFDKQVWRKTLEPRG
jgi:hypothetical protein